MFFAVAGLPRDRRNFDGTPSDEAVVHALPVVVIVDDGPGCVPVVTSIFLVILCLELVSNKRRLEASQHPAPDCRFRSDGTMGLSFCSCSWD